MKALWRDFARDESGVILSAELVIILTIAVLGMVVGLSNIQQGILGEFNDLTMAFQSLNQSYALPSYRGCWKWWGPTSWVSGSYFYDYYDGCVGNYSGLGYTGGCGAAGCMGGDIVGNGGYYLPSQVNQTTSGASISCPPAGQTSTGTSTPLPVPSTNQVPPQGCSTCP